MRIFAFEKEQSFTRPLFEVFAFFSDARNLERITPPWLRFRILSTGPVRMEAGTVIDYDLRIRGIPVRWRSEITVWEPPRRFVDIQVRGPYRLWEHEHSFREEGPGTRVRDRVRYAILGGPLVRRLFVEPDLKRIFDYREKALSEIFGGK